MKRRIFFPDTKPGIKLFWLLFLVVLSASMFSILGLVAGKLIFHRNLASLVGMLSQPESETAKSFLYIFQLINQIGVFILPPLLFAYLFSTNSSRYLKIRLMPSLRLLLLAGISIYTILPFIDRKSTRLNSSPFLYLVCRLLLEKKKKNNITHHVCYILTLPYMCF